MKYRIVHTTNYEYESTISVSHNRVFLTPRDGAWVRNLWHRLTVHPAPQWSVKRNDVFGEQLCACPPFAFPVCVCVCHPFVHPLPHTFAALDVIVTANFGKKVDIGIRARE